MHAVVRRLYRARVATRIIGITFPGGVIVGIIRKAIFSAYMTVCIAGLILGPLIVLHGYRAWWLDVPFGVLGIAAIGGNIAHYRAPRGHDNAVHGA
jgi:hypothetical protein